MQAARLLGASRVVAACRDAHGLARATEPGADVADLSGDDAAAVAALLAPHGRLVNLGSAAGAGGRFSSATLRSGPLSVPG